MRRKMIVWPVMLVVLCGLLLAHGNKPWPVPKAASARKNPVPSGPDSLTQAKELYEKNCLMCHGQAGDGKGPGAKALPIPPGNFTDAHMMKEMTDGEIFYKISEGRMPMPGFKTKLSDEQRWHLVNYLRSFAKKAPAKPKPTTKGAHAH